MHSTAPKDHVRIPWLQLPKRILNHMFRTWATTCCLPQKLTQSGEVASLTSHLSHICDPIGVSGARPARSNP